MTELRDMIERAGGLHRAADLARRWKVTRARAAELVKAPDFPAPVTRLGGEVPVWAGDEADEWRAIPRRVGRPPHS